MFNAENVLNGEFLSYMGSLERKQWIGDSQKESDSSPEPLTTTHTQTHTHTHTHTHTDTHKQVHTYPPVCSIHSQTPVAS